MAGHVAVHAVEMSQLRTPLLIWITLAKAGACVLRPMSAANTDVDERVLSKDPHVYSFFGRLPLSTEEAKR